MKIEIKKKDGNGRREILLDGKNVAKSVLNLEVSYSSDKIPTVSITFVPDELLLEESGKVIYCSPN